MGRLGFCFCVPAWRFVDCYRYGVGDDAHIVPKPIGEVVEKYIRNAPEIEKYVIMPDHVHMIIRLDDGAMRASPPTKNRVAGIVRSIKVLTTKEVCRR